MVAEISKYTVDKVDLTSKILDILPICASNHLVIDHLLTTLPRVFNGNQLKHLSCTYISGSLLLYPCKHRGYDGKTTSFEVKLDKISKLATKIK